MFLVARGEGAGPAADLLPDLVQVSPYALTGATVVVRGKRRHRLGFGSAVRNAGQGPLLVEGRRASTSVLRMTADQLVARSDGSRRLRPRVGALRYTRSTSHAHWHLLRFDRYQLRSAGAGGLVRPDHKTGFCLGDRYDPQPDESLPGEPAQARYTEECGKNRPALLRVSEGISVGYGDDYDPQLEGQYVDITGLPAGRYELVHVVNGDRRLLESDYSNNAASILLDLSWRGLAGPPRIDVVRRCGDGRRCRAAG